MSIYRPRRRPLDRSLRFRHVPRVRTGTKEAALKQESIDRGLERLREVLRDRSLKMSKVRESIARAALSYKGHFSVDELVQALHDSGVMDAHLATVYRAVPLMVEAGLIQQALISKADGQRYEASFEREHHDHLVCTSCGRVVEYQSEAMEALQREIARRFDFELDDHVLELRGRCKACRRGDH
jgi:Fur family transcriptional regulator, ferric uptake regulator